MRLIGLCGRSGSGKGVFSEVAVQNGIFVIDCDKVYKELVSKPTPLLDELENEFGSEIIKNGTLDRKTLAPIVFSDKEKLQRLNKITHKHIRREIGYILSSLENDIVLLDAPTLFESGINEVCDLIVGVVASDDVCLSRIVERDNISEENAKLRLSNQPNLDFFIENCDCIIYNDQSLEEFKSSSLEIVSAIKERKL